MNPFNWSGPEFLFFYWVIGVLTLRFVSYRLYQQESSWPLPTLNMIDPYEIANLRAGEAEALRIAALSLIDRGLLVVREENLETKSETAVESARRPIEKALLRKFVNPRPAHEIFSDESLRDACSEYRIALQRKLLIAGPNVYAARRSMFFLGVAILVGVAGTKTYLALQRGKHNVSYLSLSAVIFLVVLIQMLFKRRSGLGDRVLTDLRTLFKGLKDRAMSIPAGGATNEAALLAAIFGVGALPTANFAYTDKLFPKISNTDSSGSSCGSSGGSSCGGGCGGGGCGGCGGD